MNRMLQYLADQALKPRDHVLLLAGRFCGIQTLIGEMHELFRGLPRQDPILPVYVAPEALRQQIDQALASLAEQTGIVGCRDPLTCCPEVV